MKGSTGEGLCYGLSRGGVMLWVEQGRGYVKG